MHIIESENTLRVIPPKMLCDTSLGEDIPAPCPRGHFFWGIFGGPGRGKSSYLISLLTSKGENRVYRKVFHNIFFCVPANSMASVSNSIFRDHDEEKLFTELDVKTLEHIKSVVEHEALEGFNSLLVIDDMTAFLKDRGVEKLLRYLVYNRRHLRLSIFILAQSYSQLPLSIRKTLSHFTMFAPSNKKETNTVFEELIFLDRATADEVVRYAFQEKHDTLFGNTLDGTIYRNFNRLTLRSD